MEYRDSKYIGGNLFQTICQIDPFVSARPLDIRWQRFVAYVPSLSSWIEWPWAVHSFFVLLLSGYGCHL